jgi:hypothetical protein
MTEKSINKKILSCAKSALFCLGFAASICTLGFAQDSTTTGSQTKPASGQTATPATKGAPAKAGMSENPIIGTFAVTENLQQGHFITLQNGVTYDVSKRYRKITSGWKSTDNIRVIELKKGSRYRLENVATNQHVRAKVAKSKPTATAAAAATTTAAK